MILIVDDNHENIFSLKTLLSLHHFEVDFASSGEEDSGISIRVFNEKDWSSH